MHALRGQVVRALNGLRGVDLLNESARRWENHKIYCKFMRRVFLGLDRSQVWACLCPRDVM